MSIGTAVTIRCLFAAPLFVFPSFWNDFHQRGTFKTRPSVTVSQKCSDGAPLHTASSGPIPPSSLLSAFGSRHGPRASSGIASYHAAASPPPETPTTTGWRILSDVYGFMEPSPHVVRSFCSNTDLGAQYAMKRLRLWCICASVQLLFLRTALALRAIIIANPHHKFQE